VEVTEPPARTALTAEELAFLQAALDLARGGDTAELGDLIERGLPANLTNSSGDTLLILAAYHGHAGTVQLLLNRGADHARVNDRGQTALGAAVFRRSAAAVQALVAAGADPGLGRMSGRAVATFFGLPEMLALLDAAPGS
jgi:ankyrin repeat protein